MTPRAAGVGGMILGLGLCIVAGVAIAHPPYSLAGALLLVAATILLSVGASWTVRKSWDRSSWPDMTIPAEKALRRLRRLAVMQSAIAPLLIGGGIYQQVTGGFGLINIASGVLFLGGVVGMFRLHRFGAGQEALRQADGPDASQKLQ